MNIVYLKKEMLINELVIRGVVVDASKTVDTLRSTLRPLLKLEKTGAFNLPPYKLKFEDEKLQIRTYLDEASEAISNLGGEGVQNRFLSTQSRLVHLLNRVNRIPLASLSSEEQAERADLLVGVLSALDALESASRQDPELSQQFQDADQHVPPQNSPPPHGSPHFHSTQNPGPSQFPVLQTLPAPKPLCVEKWNLKFTGDNKKLSVHNFLERVDELRSARHVTTRQLFDSAIDLFQGKLLIGLEQTKTDFTIGIVWLNYCVVILNRLIIVQDFLKRSWKGLKTRQRVL